MEQKQKLYKEYVDIDLSLKLLEKNKTMNKEKRNSYANNLEEYTNVKRQTVDLIKEIHEDSSMSKLYCEFINKKMSNKNVTSNPNMMSMLTSNFDLLQLNKEDLTKDKISNLDLQFNQVDNNIFKLN